MCSLTRLHSEVAESALNNYFCFGYAWPGDWNTKPGIAGAPSSGTYQYVSSSLFFKSGINLTDLFSHCSTEGAVKILIFNVNNIFYTLFYDVNWLFFSGGMLAFSMLVIIVVSRFTQAAPAAQIEGLTFSSATSAQKAATRASWDKWDVIHSAIIIGITVVIYIYFW